MPKSNRAISSYLTDNALKILDSKTLEFVMSTAVAERFNVGLAVELSGDADAQQMLRAIEDRDLFIYRLDHTGEWYRFHHLFADFLRERLREQDPDRFLELHMRAAHWFAGQGMWAAAVDHFVAAGDIESATTLVESGAMEMVESGQLASLVGLAAKLPEQVVAGRLQLQLALGWCFVLTHHTDEGMQCIERARGLLSGAEPNVETLDHEAEVGLIEACLLVFMDRAADLQELVGRVIDRRDTMRAFCLVAAANVAGYIALQRFDNPAAARWAHWSRKYFASSGGAHAPAYSCMVAGYAAHRMLDLDGAETFFRQALEFSRQSADAVTYLTRLFGPPLAELLYERNELTEAKRILDDSAELDTEGGIGDQLIATFAIGARVDALLGLDPNAKLDAGANVARQLGLRRLDLCITRERVILGQQVADEVVGEPLDSVVAFVAAEVELETSIRQYLAVGEYEQALASCRVLVANIDRKRRPHADLLAQLLLCECKLAAGEDVLARARLAAVVEKCATVGLVRPVIDIGARVRSLVGELDAELSVPGRELVAAVRAAPHL